MSKGRLGESGMIEYIQRELRENKQIDLKEEVKQALKYYGRMFPCLEKEEVERAILCSDS